jgi:hypothetical protein
MKELIYISYYTEGYYKTIIDKYLLPSLQKFNLPYKIYSKPNLHDWLQNGKQKFEIIYNRLINGEQNIVFLDADAEIIRFPELFYKIPEEYDIGVHYLDWYLFWHGQPHQHKKELLGATIYINNNSNTQQLFKEVYHRIQHSSEWGQKLLQQLIEKNKSIKIYNLPIEYCYIKKGKDHCKDAIIIQHQASRKIKNKEEIL